MTNPKSQFDSICLTGTDCSLPGTISLGSGASNYDVTTSQYSQITRRHIGNYQWSGVDGISNGDIGGFEYSSTLVIAPF
jgi:hypothetical protein